MLKITVEGCTFIGASIHLPYPNDYDGIVESILIVNETFRSSVTKEEVLRVLRDHDSKEIRIGVCVGCGRMAPYNLREIPICKDKDFCEVASVMES